MLKPHSPAPEVAAIIEARSLPTDLILITQTPLASSLNFYYKGTLEQWAIPFREKITHVPWRDFFERMGDEKILISFEKNLRICLKEGRRVWVLSGKGMPINQIWVNETKDPLEAFPSYLRAMLKIHYRVLEILYQHAKPIYEYSSREEDYWEKYELALFEPREAKK